MTDPPVTMLQQAIHGRTLERPENVTLANQTSKLPNEVGLIVKARLRSHLGQ